MSTRTNATTVSVAGSFGLVQMCARDAGVLLDVQGGGRGHYGADGVERRDHGFVILNHTEARAMVEGITSILDAEAEPAGQAALQFRARRAA
jgi:hypothetical protein